MERWVPVVGWETRYEVSSEGRVRSLDYLKDSPLHPGKKFLWRGKLLTPVDIGNGYFRVYLGGKRVFVHRIVCEAFHGPAPEGKQLVLHGDANPANNKADNLRWGSHQDNEADKRSHGNNPESNKTHCPKNHPYDEANTRYTTEGYRVCKTCTNLSKRLIRERGLDYDSKHHGTINGYLGYGCRCEDCKEANRAYSAERRKRARENNSCALDGKALE